MHFISFDGGIREIGASGKHFCFDNETPRHRTLVEPYALADRLVTNGEYLEFIRDGGYRRPEFWLSDGWTHGQRRRLDAPDLLERSRSMREFTLARPAAAAHPPRPFVTSATTKPTRLRAGRVRACRPKRNGSSPPQSLPVDRQPARTAARCIRRAAERAARHEADVRRRLGMDRIALRRVSRLSTAVRRARRIQRQVHVQPAGAARRLVRHAAPITSARATATSSTPHARWQFMGVRLARNL